jgi:formylglycine-generating enzyme required for sulfatase activity
MENASSNPISHKRKALIPCLVGLVAATLIGAALLLRGPPPLADLPQMAEQPVILSNGVALFVQKYEVSVAEWNSCHDAGACTLALHVTATQNSAKTPATGLSYLDVSEYLAWINEQTGHDFRLPTIAEWEFMAAEVLPLAADPIFTDPNLSWAATYSLTPETTRALLPSGAFATTLEGIVDLNGNVWEWTAECFSGASAGDISIGRCPAYFVGGEHIAAISYLVRDPARGGCAVGTPPAHLGMRLVSDHKPI